MQTKSDIRVVDISALGAKEAEIRLRCIQTELELLELMRTPRMPRGPRQGNMPRSPFERSESRASHHLYQDLVRWHGEFGQGNLKEAFKQDISVHETLVELQVSRQKMIALFMDIMLQQVDGEPLFFDRDDLFISIRSDLRFVSRSLFRTVVNYLPGISRRESQGIVYILDSLELKEDYKNSWLSKACNSEFWNGVVVDREKDAKKRLSSFFKFLDSWQLIKQLKPLDRVQRISFLEFCWRLESYYERVVEETLDLDKKALIDSGLFSRDMSPTVREAVLSTPCIYARFTFIKD